MDHLWRNLAYVTPRINVSIDIGYCVDPPKDFLTNKGAILKLCPLNGLDYTDTKSANYREYVNVTPKPVASVRIYIEWFPNVAGPQIS